MVLRLAAILIFHKAGAVAWNLVPGSWYLQPAAVCASLLPSVGERSLPRVRPERGAVRG
jgi:hypothetical protein